MGKAKRNKRQDLDDQDDDTPEPVPVLPNPAPSKNKKKAKGGGARFAALAQSDEEDAEEHADINDDDEPVKMSNGGGKGRANAFAMLDGDDSDNEVSNKVEDLSLDAKPAEKVEPTEASVVDPFAEDNDDGAAKKKKKGGKKQVQTEDAAEGGNETGTVKTKAQKAAEKKERDKKKREQEKAKKSKEQDEFAAALAEAGVVLADDYTEQPDKKTKKKKKKKAEADEAEDEEVIVEKREDVDKDVTKEAVPAEEAAAAEAAEEDAEEGDEDDAGKKKKKKKKKGAAATEEEKRKTKPTAHAKRLKEHLELMKAQEEEMKRLQEEAEKEADRKEEERLEKIRLEEERKQRKREKEKERKERQKKEGTYLTKAERIKRDKAQAALEAMKQQGIIVPGQEVAPTEKVADKPAGKVRYGARQRKKKPQNQNEAVAEEEAADTPPEETADSKPVTPTNSWEMLDSPKEDIADDWDASDTDDTKEEPEVPTKKPVPEVFEVDVEDSEDEDDEDEDEESDDSDDDEEAVEDDESDDGSSDEDLDPEQRIEARRVRAEQNKNPDVLRAPILCVLGHVDTGKTTILDKLRRTNVQEGEAGGITQQIGATNVPMENILQECAHLNLPEMKLPGMLIIDTPGHESFSNLRSRGSSLCDMAILVVDIMHGLEPQTIESLNLLKKRKTPFIIALNKIDRLYEWKTAPKTPVEDVLKKQKKITRDDFEDRTKQAIVQIAEQGLNARLFYDNPDKKSYISVVPVSGISGDGMADLMGLACQLAQTMLAPQLIYKNVLEAMILEVKAIHGLGTTVDVILRNGQIREGDTLVMSGFDGAFTTTVRALLTPHPMKEMRVKNNYVQHKLVQAAQGIKICARDMEKTLAGMALNVAKYSNEAPILMEKANRTLTEEMKSIKSEMAVEGVYVQASTLGSLEALLEFLKTSKIKYSGVSIGPVHKKDVMKASVMLQHDREFACLLAFDVKVEREAQELADSLGVRIFTADIIYHLYDAFIGYKDELKQRRKEENRNNAVFPCRLRVIPTCIFNSRDPIVIGVTVINGVLRPGTPICVPSKEFVYLGVITSLEMNNKQVEVAHTGMDVCIKIENVGGDAPKLYGRHFDENDVLVSRISRESIDILKEHFRDDMTKDNWNLVKELKKVFDII